MNESSQLEKDFSAARPISEKRLLAASLKDRKAYEEVKSRLPTEQFSPLGALIAGEISLFYDRDPNAASCERGTILERLRAKLTNPKQLGGVESYFGAIPDEISAPNLVSDIKGFRLIKLGEQISLGLANGADSRKIRELMNEYQELEQDENPDSEDEVYQGVAISEIVGKSFSTENLIKLLPKALNDRCDGGARPGHHILVYARPEIGKTLFVINLTAGFLEQGLPVLYVGNEDPASDILLRLVGRLSGGTKAQILKNPENAERRARSKGYDLLTMASLAPGNFFEIRKLVEKYGPKVVILDQLRNLEVYSESRVQALEKAATEARNLAKRHSLVVVSVTQAGESAERKAVWERDDIDFSKTGIPAQVDLMIGIGADENMERMGLRTISLPKNKLSGNHDHFAITINPQLGTVEGAV
jgi:archaellum biogenesis ATPase FlaH